MTKTILFCATVDYHFEKFHLPYMQWFKEQGWEVHVAANGSMDLPYVDRKYTIPVQRSPLQAKNRVAYRELKALVDTYHYDIIHCHTPMGGVLARLAARKARKLGTKVIYTAHGFHFCKGSPLMNWLLYYPIEKLLSAWTDTLITINEEDYELARARSFKAKRITHVHGVGVDIDRYTPVHPQLKLYTKREHGFHSDDFLLFYAAEFNRNKNQQMLIRMMSRLKEEAPQVKLLLAGDGPLLEACRELALALGVDSQVRLLGYRGDIDELLPMCDAAVSSSLREGLPVNIMEAMSCELPIVATDNRGHRDLVKDNINGYLFDPQDIDGFAGAILNLARNAELRLQLGHNSRLYMFTKFSVPRVLDKMIPLYLSMMTGPEQAWEGLECTAP